MISSDNEKTATKVVSKSLHEDRLRPVIINQKRREALKRAIKRNTTCIHSTVYSQVTFVCRRITLSYEEGKISEKQAMDLIFEAHDQMAHQGLPKEIVTEEMHKRLDKLEGGDKSLFGIVMANTNSSIYLRKKPSALKEKEEEIYDSEEEEKYSESYWADVI